MTMDDVTAEQNPPYEDDPTSRNWEVIVVIVADPLRTRFAKRRAKTVLAEACETGLRRPEALRERSQRFEEHAHHAHMRLEIAAQEGAIPSVLPCPRIDALERAVAANDKAAYDWLVAVGTVSEHWRAHVREADGARYDRTRSGRRPAVRDHGRDERHGVEERRCHLVHAGRLRRLAHPRSPRPAAPKRSTLRPPSVDALLTRRSFQARGVRRRNRRSRGAARDPSSGAPRPPRVRSPTR